MNYQATKRSEATLNDDCKVKGANVESLRSDLYDSDYMNFLTRQKCRDSKNTSDSPGIPGEHGRAGGKNRKTMSVFRALKLFCMLL